MELREYTFLKKLPALLTGAFCAPLLMAQIPNASFEEWTIENGVEEPAEWTTNNDPGYISISKSTDSNSGEFAMQLINNGLSFEGPLPGHAMTVFAPAIAGDAIIFHAKCDSIWGTGTAVVNVLGLSFNEVLPIASWQMAELIPEYTMFEIVTGDLLAYDSIMIHVFADGGLDPLGQATGHIRFYIDDISTEFSTGINDRAAIGTMDVFPSATGILVRDPDLHLEKIQMWDSNGRLIYENKISGSLTIDRNGMASGAYTIIGIDRNGAVIPRKIVLE